MNYVSIDRWNILMLTVKFKYFNFLKLIIEKFDNKKIIQFAFMTTTGEGMF